MAVLASWNWKQRPVAVVAMPSDQAGAGHQPRPAHRRHRPASLLGALGYATDDGPGPRRHNSAQRLATVWRALTVPDALRDALASDIAAPVLLVDDQIDTGWTMTVAAMRLREAGAPAVLPLALAVTTG